MRLLLLLCAVTIGLASTLARATPVPEDEQLREPEPIKPDLDHPRLKDAAHSLIPWGTLKPERWLNVRLWIQERDLRDQDPYWRIKMRLSALPEQVGKVVSCVGVCVLRRGLGSNRVRYLSRVVEGDEIVTEKNSYLWMLLTDGTLVRLAPESSLALMEMDVSAKKFFFHARLNQGMVYWKARNRWEQVVSDLTETDRLFLPLLDPEVNLESFQRAIYRSATEEGRFLLASASEVLAQKERYEKINGLIRENNTTQLLDHEALIVAPNASVLSINRELTLFYRPLGSSYILSKSKGEFDTGEGRENNTAVVFARGFNNTERTYLDSEQWHEMDAEGKNLAVMENVPPLLAASEILTKRIPSLILLREKWLAQTKGLWQTLGDSEALATNWGLRLWGDELAQRLDFLQEYTRRIETSNLRALARVTPKPGPEFDGRYFSRALEAYFRGIKQRYSHGNTSVLEMVPMHYYGWVLINAHQ